MSGHTEGPWRVNTCDGRLPIVRRIPMPHGEADTYQASIQTLTREHVCKLDFGYGKPVDEANARLIASAPDLLAALHLAAEALDAYSDVNDGEDGPTPNTAMSALQEINAVIARAEGRS